MDQIIKQNWWQRNKKLSLGIVIFVVSSFVTFWIYGYDYVPEFDYSKLRIGNVLYGEFQEIVVANGSAEPKTTVLLDANEGGTVTDILVEEGELVSAGQILLLLSNDALTLDYMQRETQMVEQINNLRNTRINLRQNLRITEDQLDDFLKEFQLASEQYRIDSILADSEMISEQKYNESKVNYLYLRDKVISLRERNTEDHLYHGAQIGRIDNSISLMERNLELIRNKLSEMSIQAPISGQLNSFDIEPGQVLQSNQMIGRIDVPEIFWVKAIVDQHYLSRLNEGQRAKIVLDNKDYSIVVVKVFSTVENGQIEVFLEFDKNYPKGLRRGQNFQVYIEVSAKDQAIKLPKGAFYNSSAGKYVYIVSEDGRFAIKQKVALGRQNPNFYEVLGGLAEGQEVIISSYEGFKENDKIELIK